MVKEELASFTMVKILHSNFLLLSMLPELIEQGCGGGEDGSPIDVRPGATVSLGATLISGIERETCSKEKRTRCGSGMTGHLGNPTQTL